MEDATCISFDLIKFGFGFYQARLDFDNKRIIHSLFETHAKILHVPNVEYSWEDCKNELEVKRRGLSRFTITQVHLFQLKLGVYIIEIEEDRTYILAPQEIELVNYNIVSIDWNFNEEDNILERIENMIEKTKSWLRIKNNTRISEQIDPVPNVGLTNVGNRRSSRIFEKRSIIFLFYKNIVLKRKRKYQY